jgi:hypothetical protein
MHEILETLVASARDTTEKLDTLLADHQKQEAIIVLLADCRDTLTEAVGVMHSQGSDILERLSTPPQRRRPAWQAWAAGSLVGLLLLGGGWVLGSWQPPITTRDTRLLRQVDMALVRTWSTLPAPLKQELTALYGKEHLQGPGTRKADAR